MSLGREARTRIGGNAPSFVGTETRPVALRQGLDALTREGADEDWGGVRQHQHDHRYHDLGATCGDLPSTKVDLRCVGMAGKTVHLLEVARCAQSVPSKCGLRTALTGQGGRV